MPCKFVALSGEGISRIAGVDSESKRYHAVATVDCSVGVLMTIGRNIICVAMPYEFVTFYGGGVGRMTVVDGQVEGYNAVAVVNGTIGISRRVGRSIVGCAMPCESIALGGCSVGGIAGVDGKVKRHNAVAIGGIDEGVFCRGVACGVGIAVNPCVGVASDMGIGGGSVPTDGETESVVGGIGAAFVNLVGRSDVGAAIGVGGACAVAMGARGGPCEGLTLAGIVVEAATIDFANS